MWLLSFIIFIFLAYLFIKLCPSRKEREMANHAQAREEATRRIMLDEKYCEIVDPLNLPKRTDPDSVTVPGAVPDWIFSDGVKKTSTTVLIEYSSDEVTQRHVTVLFSGYAFFYGYCHLRSDYRTFRYSSVSSAVDPTTGTKIPDLKSFILERSYDESTTAQPEMVFEDGALSVNCYIIIKIKRKRTESIKNVTVLSYSHESGKIYVRCNESNKYYVFYLDDIIEVIDAGTGELITGVRSYLRKHRISR